MMNHFLDVNTTLFGTTVPVPDTARLLETHAASGAAPALSAQADQCYQNHGYYPTFTLVDYYDVGNGSVFGEQLLLLVRSPLRSWLTFGKLPFAEVAAAMNGVEYKAVKMGNGTSTTGKSTTSGGGSASSTPLNSATSFAGTLSPLSVAAIVSTALLALVA